MTPVQFRALCERDRASRERAWESANYWGSIIAAQQVNMTYRGKDATPVHAADYLPSRERGNGHAGATEKPQEWQDWQQFKGTFFNDLLALGAVDLRKKEPAQSDISR